MGNRILQLLWKQDSPKFKYGVWEFFALMLVIREIIRSSGECESTRGASSVVLHSFFFGGGEEKFGKAMKKLVGCGTFREKAAGVRAG